MANAIVSTYEISGKPKGADTPFTTPSKISTSSKDVVKLRLDQGALQGSERVGNDLVVFAGGTSENDQIIIEDFFTNDVKLVVEDEATNQLSLASYQEPFNGLTFTPIDSLAEVFAGTVSEMGGWVLPLLGVVGLGGIIAAVASDDDDDKGTPINPPDPEPEVPEPEVPDGPKTVWDVIKEYVENELQDWKDFVTKVSELPSIQAIQNIGKFIESFFVGAWETGVAFVKAIASPFVEGAKLIWDAIKLTGDLFVNLFEGFVSTITDYKPFGFVMMIFDVFGSYLRDLVGLGKGALENITGAWTNLFDVGSEHFQNVKDAYEAITWSDLLQLPLDLLSIGGMIVSGAVSSAGDFFTFLKDAFAALFDGGLGLDKFAEEGVETGKSWWDSVKEILSIAFGKDTGTVEPVAESASVDATAASILPTFGLGGLFSGIKSFFTDLFTGDGFLASLFQTIKAIFTGEGSLIGSLINLLTGGSDSDSIFTKAINFFGSLFGGASAQDAGTSIIDKIIGVFTSLVGQFKEFISGFFADFLESIKDSIFDALNPFKSGASSADVASAEATGVLDTVGGLLGGVVESIKDLVGGGFSAVFNLLTGGFTSVKEFFGNIFDNNFGPDSFLGGIKDFFLNADLPGFIFNGFSGLVSGGIAAVKGFFADAFEFFTAPIEYVIDGFTGLFQNVFGSFIGNTTDFFDSFFGAGPNFLEQVLDGVGGLVSGLFNGIGYVAGELVDGLLGGVESLGSALLDSLVGAVDGVLSFLGDLIGGLITDIFDALNPLNWLSSAADLLSEDDVTVDALLADLPEAEVASVEPVVLVDSSSREILNAVA